MNAHHSSSPGFSLRIAATFALLSVAVPLNLSAADEGADKASCKLKGHARNPNGMTKVNVKVPAFEKESLEKDIANDITDRQMPPGFTVSEVKVDASHVLRELPQTLLQGLDGMAYVQNKAVHNPHLAVSFAKAVSARFSGSFVVSKTKNNVTKSLKVPFIGKFAGRLVSDAKSCHFPGGKKSAPYDCSCEDGEPHLCHAKATIEARLVVTLDAGVRRLPYSFRDPFSGEEVTGELTWSIKQSETGDTVRQEVELKAKP